MLKGLMLCALSAVTLVATPSLALTTIPLVVAGGGGGGAYLSGGGDGRTGTAGSGDGGTAVLAGGGGGAGVLSAGDPVQGAGYGGMSGPGFSGGAGFINGGGGGFGGGGGGGFRGGGGGGGYSGGDGGGAGFTGGVGGASYLDASLSAIGALPSVYTAGANGFITITYLPVGADAVSQTFGYIGAEQSYTFAATGLYSIVAAGGRGGDSSNAGGWGAEIGGQGAFSAGTTLSLIVGGRGADGYIPGAGPGGGGGGSFVFLTSTPSDAVPEPASWAMMILGFGGAGVVLRGRRKAFA